MNRSFSPPLRWPWEPVAPPPAGELQLWWSRLPAAGLPAAAREALGADVDAATRQRAARMRRPEDQDRVLAAHALLRRVAGPLVGQAPPEVRLATHCRSCDSREHGKPYLVDAAGNAVGWEFNLTHSGQVVAVLLARAGTPVGVDAEHGRPHLEWDSLRRVFHPAEWAAAGAAQDPALMRLGLWARKEATVKTTGHGLSLPLEQVRVDGPAHGWTARLPARAELAASLEITGCDVALAPGHAVAVAALLPAGGRFRLSIHRAEAL